MGREGMFRKAKNVMRIEKGSITHCRNGPKKENETQKESRIEII
jgi:hypothetical protein